MRHIRETNENQDLKEKETWRPSFQRLNHSNSVLEDVSVKKVAESAWTLLGTVVSRVLDGVCVIRKHT